MTIPDPIQEEVLGPMQVMFRPPHFDQPEVDQALALKGYTAVLKGFDAPTLRTAWTAIVAAHNKPSWPLPAQIVRECHNALRSSRSQSPQEASTGDSYTAKRLAWERARCERLAFVAVQNGVAWAFKHAVLFDGKRPEQVNIPELCRQKMEAVSTKDRIEGDESHFWHGRSIGVIEGDDKIKALTMWANIERSEQLAADEIRRHQMDRATG